MSVGHRPTDLRAGDAREQPTRILEPLDPGAVHPGLLLDARPDEEVEVLYTAGNDDSRRLRQFHTTNEGRDKIVRRFREEETPKLLVVHNMLLTGFDRWRAGHHEYRGDQKRVGPRRPCCPEVWEGGDFSPMTGAPNLGKDEWRQFERFLPSTVSNRSTRWT